MRLPTLLANPSRQGSVLRLQAGAKVWEPTWATIRTNCRRCARYIKRETVLQKAGCRAGGWQS
eukprot:12750201-Alexandrium_andersonii.AAC.1